MTTSFVEGGERMNPDPAVQELLNRKSDDPDADGTDLAHPAWWRGHDDGVAGAVRRIRAVLDGQDDGSGVLGDAALEQVRRDILELLRAKAAVERVMIVLVDLVRRQRYVPQKR